tara:strand:- start:724 stop:954 length:231 start_codon:yes stop_codon:yes gene_type:complete
MSNNSNFSQIKDWLTLSIAVVAAIASVIFWVQSADDGRITRVESEITELKHDMKEITKQNSEILRLIGRIEGAMNR